VLLAAVLVTAVAAFFGAAGGSWAGERTFASLPSPAALQRLLTAAVPDPDPSQNLPPFRVSIPGNADRYFLNATPAARHPDADPTAIATAARDRITAAGWTVTSFVTPAYPDPEKSEAGTYFDAAYLSAHRDGVNMYGRVAYQYDGGQFYLGEFSATLFAQRAAAYLPLTIFGGMIGAVAGWLLVAALAYRRRSLPAGRRRTVSVLTGAALVTAAPPVLALAHNAIQLAIHLHDTRFPVFTLHSVLRPGSYAYGQPTWLMPTCTVAAAALGALAIAACLTRATHSPATTARLAGLDDDR
jgi:hypothetical protein